MKWPLAVAASLLNLFLLALAGGLLLLTTVPLEIDGTPHKEYLLPAVQKHTGLAVGVDGEIRLEIGPRLGLRVEGLQVANPESPGSPQLLAAELAALRIDTAALPALAASKASIPVELSGDVLGLRVDVKGQLADPNTGAAMDATLSVAGKSLTGLRPWVGDVVAGLGPVTAKLRVKGGGNAYRLTPFELAVDEGRFDGSLSLDLSGTRPRVDLDLGIAEVDIRPLFKGTTVVADSPTQASGGSGRLFSETPLPTSWLDAADVAARVRIRNLVTPYNTSRSVDIEARLQARRLRVDLAGRAIGNRSVTAKLEIDATAEPPAARLGIQGDKLMIAPLVAGTVVGGMIEGDMDLSLDARAAGTSSAELARSLSGKLIVLIERAQADLTHLNRLTPGVRDLLGQLAKPNRKLARMNCGVAAFEFQGGRTQVRSRVDTPDSTTVAHGYIDFGAETLEVRVVPDAKGVNLKVPVPIVVQGSLARPDYRLGKGVVLLSLTDLATTIALPQVTVAFTQQSLAVSSSGGSDREGLQYPSL